MVCKKLATDATLDKVLCVCSGRQPIETCMEGLAYKGPSCGVMATKSGMDFCQKLPPFLFRDAPLKDSGGASLIKLSLVDLVGFRPPHNATARPVDLRRMVTGGGGQDLTRG